MADPGKLARDLIQKNWPKFGTFNKSVTYISKAATTYNPATGQVTPGADQSFALVGMFDTITTAPSQFSKQQNDDVVVLAIDKKFSFPAADLAATPKIGDQVSASDGIWRVIAIKSDPKPALWELHVRPLVES